MPSCIGPFWGQGKISEHGGGGGHGAERRQPKAVHRGDAEKDGNRHSPRRHGTQPRSDEEGLTSFLWASRLPEVEAAEVAELAACGRPFAVPVAILSGSVVGDRHIPENLPLAGGLTLPHREITMGGFLAA